MCRETMLNECEDELNDTAVERQLKTLIEGNKLLYVSGHPLV